MRYLRLILLIILLAGCHTFEIGLVQTPTPTLRVTVTSTATVSTMAPDHTATALPTSTATITPAATRRPTLRPTSTPIIPTATSTPPSTGPTILNFSVEPAEADPGDIVTLHWSVANADGVDVYQRAPDTLPSYATLVLPAAGAITQTILERERLWHAYELAAPYGSDLVRQTVTVTIRCPYTYFFSPLPAEDQVDWSCPDGGPIPSMAAEQIFEDGRMIWLQHDDRIYVFFNDGRYQTFEDSWVAGQPDVDPTFVAPADRIVPVRGFGKVWSGDAEVRARLGWALAGEHGFQTQLQGGWIRCCSRLSEFNRPIYLRDIEGRIIRLWAGEMPPGQWQFVTP